MTRAIAAILLVWAGVLSGLSFIATSANVLALVLAPSAIRSTAPEIAA